MQQKQQWNLLEMRKLYEDDKSLAAERELAATLESKWRCKLHKLPISYHLDYMATRTEHCEFFNETTEKAVSFIELKCRTCKHDAFDTYMLALSKLVKARELSQNTGLPVFLGVKWSDRMGFVRLNTCQSQLGIGGRKDRKDWQDIEPVVHIPIYQFNYL